MFMNVTLLSGSFYNPANFFSPDNGDSPGDNFGSFDNPRNVDTVSIPGSIVAPCYLGSFGQSYSLCY